MNYKKYIKIHLKIYSNYKYNTIKMDYVDTFHPTELNDYEENQELEKRLETIKKIDRGYNKTMRLIPRNNLLKKSKVEFYTTGETGSNIRDAQSGEYYPNIVGTLDEELFFKVTLATGECKSKNGSNVLFYLSPQQYMSHFNTEVNNSIINKWTDKRNIRLKTLTTMKDSRSVPIIFIH